jgi:cytoskeletal protein CcmA (bactofilin family)
MFGKSSSKPQSIQSLIGAGTIIVGNISFSGGLRIDGVVQGNIKAVEGTHSMLVVSEQAKIDGEIHAAHLVVNGTINGPVYATQLVELQPKARVKGDVIYNAIEMHHGATVAGNLKHHAAQEAQLALPAPKIENKGEAKPDAKKLI